MYRRLISLNFNPHTTDKEENFIPVLNEMGSVYGNIKNLGIYAHITKIEHSGSIEIDDYETYVSMDVEKKEVPGALLKAKGNNKDPWKLSFKSLFNH